MAKKDENTADTHTRTKLDTIELTGHLVRSWETPSFQRQVRVTPRLLGLVKDLKVNGGVVPGILTIGILDGRKYRVDGQHRIEAFLLSELPVGYCDVRFQWFDTMADMGKAFVALQDSFVKMKPDDVLRGMEGSTATLALLRKECPFVGYDSIRRGPTSPVVGMSQVVRAWVGSNADTPGSGSGSAAHAAEGMTLDEASACCDLLKIAHASWGSDRAYGRLWGVLNMTLCMWLYRNIVQRQYSARAQQLSADLFKKCLMALSADEDYCAWLVGRNLTDRDRSPAYTRIRDIFARRYEAETQKKLLMPKPAWASSQSGS